MESELVELAGTDALIWRAGPGWRMVSSGVLGGGTGERGWVLNAQVPLAYERTDPATHLRELAAAAGLTGPGVGMLTATAVRRYTRAREAGVAATATVGLTVPTWAAAPAAAGSAAAGGGAGAGPVPEQPRPGTVNVVVSLPVPLQDAALVNAVITATEAKTQALLEAGLECTGTASDALCVAAPVAGAAGAGAGGAPEPVPFCGPRALWGARLARVVHAAVRQGAERWLERHGTAVAAGHPAATPAGTAPRPAGAA